MLHDDRPKKPHGSVPLPHHTETLKSIAARLRKTMGDAQCGLTSVAVEVMSLASDWGRHKAEAGGLEIGRWARKELHPTWRMNKYRELAEAAERAGPFWNRIPSNALLWMHNQIPAEDAFNAALKDVSALFNKQGGLLAHLFGLLAPDHSHRLINQITDHRLNITANITDFRKL